MLLVCKCGTTNRIPSLPTKRVRCGKCQHLFTPQELVQAKPEAPPERPTLGGMMAPEERWTCKKCKWEGTVDDCEMDDNDRHRCPECNSTKLVDENKEPVNE